MGKAYKNFWSLNIDEAIAVGILREKLSKKVSIFMPTSAQMPDVDLVAINLSTKRIATIQVKGSRAFEPSKSQTRLHGHGSAGWFYFDSKKMMEDKVDYFLFLVYVLEPDKRKGRMRIEPHAVLIATKELKKRCVQFKRIGASNKYNFHLWINPVKKQAFDLRHGSDFNVSDCLDKKGIEKLNEQLLKRPLL